MYRLYILRNCETAYSCECTYICYALRYVLDLYTGNKSIVYMGLFFQRDKENVDGNACTWKVLTILPMSGNLLTPQSA